MLLNFIFWLIIHPEFKKKILLSKQNVFDFDYLDLRSLIKNPYFSQAQSLLTSGQTWKLENATSCMWIIWSEGGIFVSDRAAEK